MTSTMPTPAGVVDTKASLIDLVVSGKTKYLGFSYESQNFSIPAPGIALMHGRVNLKVGQGV